MLYTFKKYDLPVLCIFCSEIVVIIFNIML